eukprot:1351911-Amorphochlora_amoeboformis.AAC.1
MPAFDILVLLSLSLPVSSSSFSPTQIVVGLPLRNLGALDEAFWSISTPGSTKYLKHMSVDEISAVISPDKEAIERAKVWIVNQGADSASLRVSRLGDTVTGTVFRSRGWSATETSPSELHDIARNQNFDFVMVRGVNESHADRRHRRHRRHRDGNQTSGLDSKDLESYDVSAQKRAYGIPVGLGAGNGSVLQMVWGPGTFGYDPDELEEFAESNCP